MLIRTVALFQNSRAINSFGVLQVLTQFEIWMNTPKALANFSPGLERSDYPGVK